MKNSRRNFIKASTAGAMTALAGGVLPGFNAKSYGNIMGANERVNVAIAGFHNRGIGHMRGLYCPGKCQGDRHLRYRSEAFSQRNKGG